MDSKENEQSLNHDELFLKVVCYCKLKEFPKAIQILNGIKRNQLSRKSKIKALLMKTKVYRKLRKYDLALKEA